MATFRWDCGHVVIEVILVNMLEQRVPIEKLSEIHDACVGARQSVVDF